MSLEHLFWSLLSIQCFLGGRTFFCGRLLAKQSNSRPLIPLFPLIGSQDHGVTEDQQFPRKDPWSSPRHLFHLLYPQCNTLCCILTFIPSHSIISINENSNQKWWLHLDRRSSTYNVAACTFRCFTCLFGRLPAEEPASLFQWPAACYSLCLWPLLLSEVALFDVVQSIVLSTPENKGKTGRPV